MMITIIETIQNLFFARKLIFGNSKEVFLKKLSEFEDVSEHVGEIFFRNCRVFLAENNFILYLVTKVKKFIRTHPQ